MKPKIIVVINITLVLGAILLGYLIYQQQTGLSFFEKANTQNVSSPKNLSTSPSNGAYTNEADVLKWPAPDASAEEKQRHTDLVLSLAKDAEQVDIADCIGRPIVSRVQMDQPFALRNQDSVDHTVAIGENVRLFIPAGSTKDITADLKIFEFGQGNYGYTCDNQQEVAGIFLVTE